MRRCPTKASTPVAKFTAIKTMRATSSRVRGLGRRNADGKRFTHQAMKFTKQVWHGSDRTKRRAANTRKGVSFRMNRLIMELCHEHALHFPTDPARQRAGG